MDWVIDTSGQDDGQQAGDQGKFGNSSLHFGRVMKFGEEWGFLGLLATPDQPRFRMISPRPLLIGSSANENRGIASPMPLLQTAIVRREEHTHWSHHPASAAYRE